MPYLFIFYTRCSVLLLIHQALEQVGNLEARIAMLTEERATVAVELENERTARAAVVGELEARLQTASAEAADALVREQESQVRIASLTADLEETRHVALF